jgi:hypothetical protein
MGGVKTVLVFMMVGAIVGAVTASFIVPPYLSWYASPGSITPEKHVESLCNLPEMIRYTSSWLLRGQLIGAGIGALLFLYPGIAAARRRGAAAAPAAA